MREIWNLQWLAHFLWTQTDELATVAGGNTRLHFIISLVGGVTSAGERTSAWCTYCTLQVLHGTPPSSSDRSGEIHVRRLTNLTWPDQGGTSCFASMKNDVTCTKCVCVCVSCFHLQPHVKLDFFPPEGIVWWRSTCKLELTFALAFDAILWNVPSRL